MSDHPLYLFKTARRGLYRKENLNLLAAERGTVHEYAWNRSWVSPRFFDEGAIERGTPVYFVFSERPYERFVPVRDGQVVSAVWDETLLRVRVLLNNPVAVEEVSLDTFTHLVKQTSGEHAPPEKFVVPKLDGVELRVLYDDGEVPGWRRTVDEVLEMSRESENDPYRDTVFFRPDGVSVDGGERLPSRRAVLRPGDEGTLRLHFHNPHLDKGRARKLGLRVHVPENSLSLGAIPELPLEGFIDVPFQTLEGPDPELRIEIDPAPGRHTWVLQRLVRAGQEARVQVADEAPATERTVAPESVRRTWRLVLRNGTFSAADRVDVLEAFERLDPEDQELREQRALAMLDLEDPSATDEALGILSALNREILDDRSRRLLFRHRLIKDPDLEPYTLVEQYDLASEARFGMLLDDMERLPDGTLNRLVPSLVEHLPDPAQRRDVLDRFGHRVTTAEAATLTAMNHFLVSESPEGAAQAFQYLEGMRRALGTNDRALVDALIELADAGGENRFDHELRRVVEARITNLIGRSCFQEARATLREVSPSLGGEERRHLYHEIADRLMRKDRLEEAAAVMVEYAWECCRNSSLDHATDAVERAQGLWAAAGHREMSREIREARDAVRSAWDSLDELVEWRKSADQRRRERLRKRLLNQRLLVAGGVTKPGWIAHLEELTGAGVEWCEAFNDQTDNLQSAAARVQNGRYAAVIYYLQKTGHSTGDVLKPACEAAGVPFLPTTSAGRRGVVEALEGWVGEGGTIS